MKQLENNNCFDWAKEFPKLCDKDGNFEGFDIVVGNPPYIPLSKLPELETEKDNYLTYKQTGDVYMLFIERGVQILKKGGILSYIISNKWMRASYGKSLRSYLLQNTKIDKIIDFDSLKVFDKATVDTNIISVCKQKDANNKVEAVRFDKTFNLKKDSISQYFETNKILLSNLNSDSWVLLTNKELQIKNKLIEKGKQLKNWNIKINYGIKTGLDKAFFIDQNKRNELISNDPKSAEIIEPILRGRDVHKFYIDKKKQYLINAYNGKLVTIKNKKTNKIEKKRINRINILEYPAVYEHLNKYETKLKKRSDKGKHWTNQRSCKYQELFYEEKIIYPEITGRRSEFYYDKEKHLINKTCFMITGKNLKYLIAVLSSKVVEFFLEHEAQKIGKTAIQNSKIYIEKIPIPDITEKNIVIVNKIKRLIDKVLNAKKINNKADICKEQTKIDKLVCCLYELSNIEIEIINS